MQKFRFIIVSLMLLTSTQLFARADLNPFAKSMDVTFDSSIAWKYHDDLAVKSAVDNQDSATYYHLFFDGKSLRLMLGESSSDAASSAKHYDQLAIDDVQIDGKRLPLFQWCLMHQDRHARFLQQGLSVEKNICENDGAHGAFSMRLNQQTLDALQAGKTLTFVIKPFRTPLNVNYELSDFSDMVVALANLKNPAPVAAPAPVQVSAPAAAAVSAPVIKTCTLKPPAGFETLKPITYNCNSAGEKSQAGNSMTAMVNTERDRRKKAEEQKERQKQAEIAAQKKAEEARLQAEQKKLAEAEALAASKLKQEQINADITSKMLGVCTKMWAKGEHRCYCEKYIDQAPENIRASSTCSGS